MLHGSRVLGKELGHPVWSSLLGTLGALQSLSSAQLSLGALGELPLPILWDWGGGVRATGTSGGSGLL